MFSLNVYARIRPKESLLLPIVIIVSIGFVYRHLRHDLFAFLFVFFHDFSILSRISCSDTIAALLLVIFYIFACFVRPIHQVSFVHCR